LKYQGYGLEVWDLSTPKLVATLEPKSWTAEAETFSPDGKYLAAAGDRDSVHIFETGTWKEIFSESYKQIYGIHELAFSPDSKRLAGVDLKLHMWDVQGLREVYEMGGTPFQSVTAVAASPDGQRLAVARGGETVSAETEPHDTVELWPLLGRTPQILPKKTNELDEMSFSSDSTKLAASGEELVTQTNMHTAVDTYSIGGDLLLWDLTHNREIEFVAQKGTSVAAFVPSVSFSADGKKLATGALVVTREHSYGDNNDTEDRPYTDYARLLITVDPETGNTLDELRLGRGNALLLAQSPDGQHVISANQLALRSWDLVNHKLDLKFQPQLPAASQDAADDDSSPTAYQKFQGHYQNPVVTALRYTPDGHGVLVAKDKSVLLLDAVTGAQLKEQSMDTAVGAFAFSPDGKILASSQFKAAPRLWDPKVLTSRPFESADEDCSAIAVSANGSTVVCGGTTGVLLAWDTASGSLLARILRTSDGEWLVVTPEGLFDGTPGGERLAAWWLGGRPYALEQLPKSFRHEGLLPELLAGKRPKPKEDLASALGALARPAR
jgi:WD40 repeat protein